ncbi:MAG TPA: tetratricopeptide repeat protein [Thermoanaerobaculia bacterium]|nr:tetratricopeptide repeat protein [Thermoanaerobaculia bacterium]
MAQPATNAKLDELRFKLKTDPKSRLFYQLAEELRRAGHLEEAEQYLHSGLTVYPTYLAAWVCLGRVLRDRKNESAAVDALNKALQLDPGNVVAARLLADAYLALGEKVEAIKKYKLVLALLPSDEELRATIDRIDQELQAPPATAPATPEEEAFTAMPPEEDAFAPAPSEEDAFAPVPPEAPMEAAPVEPIQSAPETFSDDERVLSPMEESPFDRTLPPFEEAERPLDEEARLESETADVEPMSVAHDESPFEEPVSDFTADAVEIESPMGISIVSAPLSAEVPSSFEEDEFPPVDSVPVFDTDDAVPQAEAGDAGNTLTMADLYVGQGAIEDARHIYESILARDPENAEVRAKLAAIAPRVNRKVAQLERWLAKVARREVGRV